MVVSLSYWAEIVGQGGLAECRRILGHGSSQNRRGFLDNPYYDPKLGGPDGAAW